MIPELNYFTKRLQALATHNQISGRINFSKIKTVIDYPDFLDVQLQSFRDFFQLETPAEKRIHEGLYKVFSRISNC